MGMVKEGVLRPGTRRAKGEDIEHKEEEQAKATETVGKLISRHILSLRRTIKKKRVSDCKAVPLFQINNSSTRKQCDLVSW